MILIDTQADIWTQSQKILKAKPGWNIASDWKTVDFWTLENKEQNAKCNKTKLFAFKQMNTYVELDKMFR